MPRQIGSNFRMNNQKLNIVLFGLPESSAGTSKQFGIYHDFGSVGLILSLIDSALSESSIEECYSLGKFKDGSSHPLLLQLYRSTDVHTILSGRRKLSVRPGVIIKPDLSLEERKVEQLLLKERRSLIQRGVPHGAIKLCGSSLFVDNKEHGEVQNNQFEVCAGKTYNITTE